MDNNWIALRACIMVEQDDKCAMCGKELEDNEFTLHHIKPRAKGGKDELDNLIGLCNMCHDTAEYKHFNREEIINCRYNSYPNKKQNKYIKILIPIVDNEMGYRYPEEIILQGMNDIITKRPIYIQPNLPIVFHITKRPNKYMLEYGRSLEEISRIFGVTRATIHNWNKVEKKKAWMESILKNI